ncbi:MAG: toll/interleukin-1 receptor domain-containing protein [Eubacterium sp.]|nr:toll/interleukin-1 receptor domain-containing protein [Eubacterium sp.]
MSDFVYDAFISYSHRDMAEAKRLQKRLETFRIPKDMLGERPARKLKVFRDQTDLAGVELNTSLSRELEASEYLIVVCSPRSAASSWVNKEVQSFIELGRADRIIPFVVEGEPESDDHDLECYPEAMRSLDDRMLLGANIQELGRNKAILRVLAILLDVRFDRLVGREKQRRRRTALIAGSTAAVIIAIVSGLLIRNALISKRNHELAYDNYLTAMSESFRYGESLENNLQSVDIEPLTASAGEGNTDAMLLLASCYENGWGTEKDPEKALYWFLKGAEAGDTGCMTAAANCLRLGTGAEADPVQAFGWYKKAAEAGDLSGMVTLGFAYEDGIGTEPDPAAAFEWYKKAAEAGNEEAMAQLTRCYRNGIGTEVSLEDAFKWMSTLADTGNVIAIYNLGLMYQSGMGTAEDPAKAYECYRKAALLGDADGMYMTGWCTENGYGTSDAALEWYKAAQAAGSEKAAEALERLSKD